MIIRNAELVRDSNVVDVNLMPLKPDDEVVAKFNFGVRPHLRDALNARGIGVVHTFGPDSFSSEGTVEIRIPGEEDSINTPTIMELGKVGVIRDIAGAFKNPDITRRVADARVTVLNGAGVRQLDDKAVAAQSGIFGDAMVDTLVIPTTQEVIDIAHSLDERMFLKPARSFMSRGVIRTDTTPPLDAARRIKESGHETYVAQPIIDSTMPFPSGILFEGEESQRIAEERKYLPKELRIFFFYGQDDNGHEDVEWLPIARFSEPTKYDAEGRLLLDDAYVYVDADTVPNELVKMTGNFAHNAAEYSHQPELSGAFDFVYGKVGKDEPRWLVGEGNFWQPVPPKRSQRPDLHQMFVDMTANQLARIVDKRVK